MSLEIEIKFGSVVNNKFHSTIPRSEYDEILNKKFYNKRSGSTSDKVVIQQNGKNYEITLDKGKIVKPILEIRKELIENKQYSSDIRISKNKEYSKEGKFDFNKEIDFFRFKKRTELFSKKLPNWRIDLTQIVQLSQKLKFIEFLKIASKTKPFYQLEAEWINKKSEPTEEDIYDAILFIRPNIVSILQNQLNYNLKSLSAVVSIELKKLPEVYNGYAITDKADGVRYGLYIDKYGNIIRFGRSFSAELIGKTSKNKLTLLDSELINNKYYLFDLMFYKGKDFTKESFDIRYKELQKIKDYPIKEFYFPKPDKVGNAAKKAYTKKHPYELDGLIYTKITSPYKRSDYKWKPREHCTIDFLIKHLKNDNNLLTIGLYITMNFKKLNYTKLRMYPETYKQFNFNRDTIRKFKDFPWPFKPDGIQELSTTKIKVDKDFKYKGIPLLDNTIVEFKFNFSGENKNNKKNNKNKLKINKDMTWIPVTFRPDKQKIYEESLKNYMYRGMNGYNTGISVWECIQKPITTEMIYSNEPPVIYFTGETKLTKSMTSFHHRLKLKYYEKYLNKGDNVLELAGGRGGDFWKLTKANFVLFADVAKDAIIELKNRINKSKNIEYNRNFIEANLSKNITKDIKKSINSHKIKEFNIVSIQFALHYFFESEKSFKNIFKNIDTYLKSGGYFMASFFEKERVKKLFKNSNTNTITLKKGNSNVFVLENKSNKNSKKNSNKNSPFGKKLAVQTETIGKHDEFLVDTKYLINFMEKNNYKLIEKVGFDDVYKNENKKKMSNSEKKFSFLNVYIVFQKK